MFVDGTLRVAVPGHKASNFAGKKDGLHALVLEREAKLREGLPIPFGRTQVEQGRVRQKQRRRLRTRTTKIGGGVASKNDAEAMART